MDFDFLNNLEPKKTLTPEVVHHGPNGKDLKPMTRKRLVQDVLDVYQQEGGRELMRLHMRADPKGFFDVIKKLMPTNLGIDADEIAITLIDAYGNQMKIEPAGSPAAITTASASRDLDLPRSREVERPQAGPTDSSMNSPPPIHLKERY